MQSSRQRRLTYLDQMTVGIADVPHYAAAEAAEAVVGSAAGRLPTGLGQSAVEALDTVAADDCPGSPRIGGMAVRADLDGKVPRCRAQAMAFAAVRAHDVEDVCLG